MGLKLSIFIQAGSSMQLNGFLKRLDHEVFDCNDILKITDIKYKPHSSQLSVIYMSIRKGINYDDIIESLAAISSEPQIL